MSSWEYKYREITVGWVNERIMWNITNETYTCGTLFVSNRVRFSRVIDKSRSYCNTSLTPYFETFQEKKKLNVTIYINKILI